MYTLVIIGETQYPYLIYKNRTDGRPALSQIIAGFVDYDLALKTLNRLNKPYKE